MTEAEQIEWLIQRNERLRGVLVRCQTVLTNLALENEGTIFRRWPISHEPLRSDARGLLPEIDLVLNPVR
jgi:hypothetical protein